MYKEPKIYSGDWWSFYFNNSFEFSFENREKYDGRPRLILAPGFCRLTLKFTFPDSWLSKNGSNRYGIAIHNQSFWIYTGGNGRYGMGKWIAWNFPFITQEWVRTSILLKENKWAHETQKNRQQFYDQDWREKQDVWHYDFTDKFDGKIIPTTIYIEEREWRPKWLTWTGLFKKVRRTIDVHFSDEVGKRKGSYKGGTVGCSYELLPGEDPIDCIKRMEKERDF